ncbi:MAG: hypothetical protein ACK5GV_01110 [Bacteroidota bacterium]|jgi:hypothetical protein
MEISVSKTPEELADELKPCPLCGKNVTLEQVTDSWSVKDSDFGGGSGSSYMHNTYNVIQCTCSLQKTLSKKACNTIYYQVQEEIATLFSGRFDPNEFEKQLSVERELYEKYKRVALIAEWNNRV